MARAGKTGTEAKAPQGAWSQARQAIVVLLFAASGALALYGAWLALLMHFTKAMPLASIGRFLGCAVLAAAIFTVCVRVEPLPARRKRRGRRWINVETPTSRHIWETAPGDFVESILALIGIMAAPAMMFIGLGTFADFEDLPDLMISTTVSAGAFALEAAFVKWRGRSMWDPPGQVRRPGTEPKAAAGRDDAPEIGPAGPAAEVADETE